MLTIPLIDIEYVDLRCNFAAISVNAHDVHHVFREKPLPELMQRDLFFLDKNYSLKNKPLGNVMYSAIKKNLIRVSLKARRFIQATRAFKANYWMKAIKQNPRLCYLGLMGFFGTGIRFAINPKRTARTPKPVAPILPKQIKSFITSKVVMQVKHH